MFVLLLLFNLHAVAAGPDLHFSNTQKWGQSYLSFMEHVRTPYLSKKQLSSFRITPPPPTGGPGALAEHAQLLALKKLRSIERVVDIRAQRSTSLEFGPFDVADFDPADPVVILIVQTNVHALQACYFQKKKYDRVRPSFLFSDVDPIIAIPQHPSFPSGHSTQAHAVAFILSELEPGMKNDFLRRASYIAENREVAGVHYPSDSSGGKELAKAVVRELLRHKDYQKLVVAARKSWLGQRDMRMKVWEKNQRFDLSVLKTSRLKK